jgi:hypothetical protein
MALKKPAAVKFVSSELTAAVALWTAEAAVAGW